MAIVPPLLDQNLIDFFNKAASTVPVNLEDRSERPRYSGFINIRLVPGTGTDLIETNNLRALAREFDLEGLSAFLEQRPELSTGRLIQSVSLEEVRRIETQAAEGKIPPKFSLASFWRLDARRLPQEERDRLIKLLGELPEIGQAYGELAAYGPSAAVASLPFEQQNQYYRFPAPFGVDADWANARSDGQGQGIQLVDVEEGGVFDHQELIDRAIATPITGDIRTVPVSGTAQEKSAALQALNHGTCVLGVVVGRNDSNGILGIAPAAPPAKMSSHYGTVAVHTVGEGPAATQVTSNVANAIYAAILQMAAGDVLLIEVELGEGLPAETDIANLLAIQAAVSQVSREIIVIEAAGNANQNLDTLFDPNGQLIGSDLQESGAIMVAASEIDLQKYGNSSYASIHCRFSENDNTGSNYGNRINCFAQGLGVTTASGIDSSGNLSTSDYTFNFGATSSAAAIIAGVALVVQGMHVASHGTRLLPLTIRSLLSDPILGTPACQLSERIGSMPNLRLIGQHIAAVPVLYMRTTSDQLCPFPSPNPVGTSFDILTCPRRIERPTQYFSSENLLKTDDFRHCEVVVNQENYIYTRIRNCGGIAANNIVAQIYSAPLATLITPDLLKPIGQSKSITVPVGFTPVVTEAVRWQPAAAGQTLIVTLAGADNRLPSLRDMQWQAFLATLCGSDSVAQRSINVIEVRRRTPEKIALPFLVTGAPEKQPPAFAFEVLRQLPEGVTVQWQIPLPLFELLSQENCIDEASIDIERQQVQVPLSRLNRVTFSEVNLPASAQYQSQLLITATDGFTPGIFSLAIRQLLNGDEVGRITWIFKPAKPRFPFNLIRRLPFLMR